MEAQTLISLTAVGLFIFSIFNYFYKHFTFWQSQGIASSSFVTMGWTKKPFYAFAEEMSRQFAPHKIYGAYGPFNKVLIINDAKIARDLSTKEMHKFPIRNSQLDQGTTNIRKSLFFMQANDDWKRIRSIVTPAFTSGKLKRMMTPIERIAENFVEHLRQEADTGKTFDLKKYINGFAMDVIACCGYGIEIDSVRNPDHPVVVNATKILNVDINFNQIICFMFPKVAKWLNLDIFDRDAVNYFDKLTFEIVEKRLKDAEGKQNPDLLGLMIEESGDGKSDVLNNNPHTKALKGITKAEMSGQGILFFIAGYDTSNSTFDHAIYYLTQYPEWQEKLYQELNAVRDELDYDKLKHLPILNSIIGETLRLNPPLSVFQRESIEDCELLDTGIKIPKNTLISIQPYVIQRNEEYFPDPNTFKPERFLDKSTSPESHIAYCPFGYGQRLCVGMRFAQNELRIGIAKLILNYKVKADKNLVLTYFKGSVLMSPKNLFVEIEKR